MEVVRHCLHTAGGKVYVLRKTERSQENTTLDTFRKVFEFLGDYYKDIPGQSLFTLYDDGNSFRLPSTDAIARWQEFLQSKPTKADRLTWLKNDGDKYCSHIHFSGVPHSGTRATRFRGYECSLLVFVEADELGYDDWVLAQACVRWKDAYGKDIETGGSILDTNPPGTKHWIAKLEENSKTERNVKFWHIQTIENSHNLPPGYVDILKITYKNDDAGYRKMVLGEYADSFDGSPVFFAFKKSWEKLTFDNMPWPLGAYLVRSHDVGTTNVTIYSAYFRRMFKPKKAEDPMIIAEYWWALRESIESASDTERQCRRVLDTTARCFPFWNDRTKCAGVLDYIDPASNNKTSTGRDVDIFRSHGMAPQFKHKDRGLQLTFAIMNRLFESTDPDGNYCFRIDRANCDRLFAALSGGYRYPREGEPGYNAGGESVPLKGEAYGGFDHPADALRYGVINAMRLASTGAEKAAPHVGQLAAPLEVNRPKQWF